VCGACGAVRYPGVGGRAARAVGRGGTERFRERPSPRGMVMTASWPMRHHHVPGNRTHAARAPHCSRRHDRRHDRRDHRSGRCARHTPRPGVRATADRASARRGGPTGGRAAEVRGAARPLHGHEPGLPAVPHPPQGRPAPDPRRRLHGAGAHPAGRGPPRPPRPLRRGADDRPRTDTPDVPRSQPGARRRGRHRQTPRPGPRPRRRERRTGPGGPEGGRPLPRPDVGADAPGPRA
jgi:hypothetical protein